MLPSWFRTGLPFPLSFGLAHCVLQMILHNCRSLFLCHRDNVRMRTRNTRNMFAIVQIEWSGGKGRADGRKRLGIDRRWSFFLRFCSERAGVDRRIDWHILPRVSRAADHSKCAHVHSSGLLHTMVADSGSHAPGCHLNTPCAKCT